MANEPDHGGRLLRLAGLLESLPAARFNYGHWVGDGWKGREDLSCGTTACALGWATTLPELRAEGLRLFRDEDSGDTGVTLGNEDPEPYADTISVSLRAARAVFVLTPKQAEFLFLPSSYYGGKQGPRYTADAATVATHIRQFVAKKYPGAAQ